jgi:ATP-dependent RNA helicase DDX56/DBP9
MDPDAGLDVVVMKKKRKRSSKKALPAEESSRVRPAAADTPAAPAAAKKTASSETVEPPAQAVEPVPPPPVSFGSLGLDARIRRALTRMRWARPTPVQRECVRLALEGKDVLARAPTGSGKTAAYVLPCVHKVLQARAASNGVGAGIEVAILVPTAELCQQVCSVVRNITRYCVGESSVKALGIAGDIALETQRAQLAEDIHILVATPGRLAVHLDAGSVVLRETVRTLVIDEADLMLSCGPGLDRSGCTVRTPST